MRTSRLAIRAIANVKTRAAELGRDPDSLGFETIATDSSGPGLLAEIERWGSAGGTHIGVHVPGRGEELLDGLDTVARDLTGAPSQPT